MYQAPMVDEGMNFLTGRMHVCAVVPTCTATEFWREGTVAWQLKKGGLNITTWESE